MESSGAHRGKPRGIRDVKVDAAGCPAEWVTGADRLPIKGERVHTSEGTGVVVRVCGKTSRGHLLELTMDDGRKPAFFAETLNIMVSPQPPSSA
jgi:hypothetical protein